MLDIGYTKLLLLPHELETMSQKEVLKVAQDKFTWNGGEIPYIGRYSGLEWNTFGLRNFDARMDHYTQYKWRLAKD